MDNQFKQDIEQGLTNYPKTLPSKYFYDKAGSELFAEIMNQPEYYLTQAELEIFQNQTQLLIDSLRLNRANYFELIELGPGNGLKTKELLQLLHKDKYTFDYIPIDISGSALKSLQANLSKDLPGISIKTQQGDYLQIMQSLKESARTKIVLFLGSTLGNLSDQVTSEFIRQLEENLRPNDKLVLGLDLIKDKAIVLPAYNDAKGVTKLFNLNLLKRINNELGADFDVNTFAHNPEYEEAEGTVKSFLVSQKKQEVTIQKIGKQIQFEEGEKILTEISRKYNDEILQNMLRNSRFTISKKLTDKKARFANYILTRN